MSDVDLVPSGFVGPAPSPVFFDMSAWPIAFVRFPELDDADRLEGVLGGLERLLDQKVPFVAVWIPASHDHDDEPHEDEIASNKWIKQHRDALNTYCKGYVYITRDTALAALLTDRIAIISGRLFTFPMKVVQDHKEALQAGEYMLSSNGVSPG
ncbi:hypothetical protein [Thalassospira sp. TSL5-1]|uniref:hypothetical protein n=1 Tax=Thalassospira sp. TSL5-1 TaxID=1544451 RepID=UPI0009391C73|nr:hypothetical protein [Thalassospira sp. TSL5-1]OKH86323.1 hypothetical protein LF95_23060 [Thalassospira sp. TSL5-1]